MDRREWLSDNEESFKTAFEGLQSGMWTALPAIVTAVNLEKQTISAQSGIKGEFKDEEGVIHPIDMPVFDDIVLCFPRAGGYAITFPVQPGDEVLLMFACRCIDGWWQSGGINNIAPEFRMHDLSDGFAILAPTSQPKSLSSLSSDSLRVMNEAQTKFVEISPSKVTVQSDGDIDLNGANINLNGDITENATNLYLNASVSIHVTAPDIYISGRIHV